jgi:hypothetical protein
MVVALLVKATFFSEEPSDFFVFFFIGIVLFLLLYNLYACFLYFAFLQIPQNKYHLHFIEMLFVFLLLAPFGLLVYLTT